MFNSSKAVDVLISPAHDLNKHPKFPGATAFLSDLFSRNGRRTQYVAPHKLPAIGATKYHGADHPDGVNHGRTHVSQNPAKIERSAISRPSGSASRSTSHKRIQVGAKQKDDTVALGTKTRSEKVKDKPSSLGSEEGRGRKLRQYTMKYTVLPPDGDFGALAEVYVASLGNWRLRKGAATVQRADKNDYGYDPFEDDPFLMPPGTPLKLPATYMNRLMELDS